MDSVRYTGCQEQTALQAGKSESQVEAEALALVERAVGGDIEAFGELYGMYLDRIYRYIFYQVSDKAMAEDLTEEVFLKAWRSIGKYRWRGQPFSAWLYRIARNHVIDHYRTNRQHQMLEDNILADTGDPEREAEGKQTQKQLLEAISTLPEQQRQVIIMKFIEDMDNREIEEATGKSQGAIRILQMRALAALRQTLDTEVLI